MLDILYEQQVPATFFLIGEKFTGNELLIREIAASGHEIGNHTFSHPDLTQLDSRKIQWEIQQTEEKLKEILPDYPMKYVRPPYGRYTEDVQKAIGLPLVLWTIDSGDWEARMQKISTLPLSVRYRMGILSFSMTTTRKQSRHWKK